MSESTSTASDAAGGPHASATVEVRTAGAEREQSIPVGACQLCGLRDGTLVFREPPYEVKRCASCGLVWVTPRLSGAALHEVYGEGYWRSESPKEKGYADYAADEPLYLKTFRRRFRLVKRFVPSRGKVLDVGCAAGFFLRTMRERGHDVYGVELSPAIGRRAIQHLGRERVHVGLLEEVAHGAGTARPGFEAGSFDLVTMWDVVEHVPDPQALLRQARTLLKPTGHLLLETQNVDSLFAKLLGRRWQHFKHQEHLYHFNRASIDLCLRQAGFETVLVTAGHGGKYVSFGFIAERAARLHPLFSWLLRPLALLRAANVYLNFGDEMVVVARPAADGPPP